MTAAQLAAVIARLDALEVLLAKRFGSTSWDNGMAVATDGTGNVLVTGSFGGTVDFGGGPLTSAGADDIFLLRLKR